ncbi:MAG: cyclic nucleotide-binding domain-containing protein, partial [Nitrospinae bacterium]|nr:cyclic nucleotide-binding domain-containing protein [Nitrospinota bacterium]
LKKTIDMMEPGCFLGEMSLIDGGPRTASVRSIGESTLIEIDNDFFQNEILTDPQASLSMLKGISHHARHNMDIIANECQHLNCLVHDLRNYLVPLSITEIKINDIIKRWEGTQSGHKKREGIDELRTGLKNMLSTRSNVVTLIEPNLSVSIRKKGGYIKEPTPIATLVQETAEETSYHKNVKGKKVTWDTSQVQNETPDLNYLDIKRVLQNLVINAGYASEKGTSIFIRVEKLDGTLQVSVTDQGSGIPEEIKPLLLKEKFTSKPDGNGFGLLSCREIIEDYHQGKFWFASEWGKGTTFSFTIPTCPSRQEGASA